MSRAASNAGAARRGRLAHAGRRLADDCGGNAVLEFAMVAPAFLLLILGTCNIGQMIFAKVLLNGAVEQAARSSSTENGDTTAADTMVQKIVGPIIPGATFTTSRYSYYDFTDVGRAEKFTDSNADGVCNHNETFIDENGNGSWDADVGSTGQGGADDIVVYQVTASYKPVFLVPFMPNQWRQFTLRSKSVKKNQPFATQSGYSSVTGTCA